MSEPFTYKYSTELSCKVDLFQKNVGQTSNFLPVPGTCLEFCFKYMHDNKQKYNDSEAALFQLRLVKLVGSEISTSLRMTVDVSVYYTDDTRFEKYSDTYVYVHKTSEITFMDVYQTHNPNIYQSRHTHKIESERLKIKCSLDFVGDSVTDFLSTNLKLFVKNFSSIYESNHFSDIKFTVSDNTLPAHKFVLAAHSPVFMRMLTADFKESQTSTITITDVSYEVFSLFLSYLYSGEISDPTWSHVTELYVVADKYDVTNLKRDCQILLPLLLTTDTVSDLFLLASKHEDSDLKKSAMEYAFQNIESLATMDQWKLFVETYPCIGYEVMSKFVSLERK